MLNPNLLVFYVKDPLVSKEFYKKILQINPLASYPTYVAFRLDNGFTVSLWSIKANNFVSGGEGHRSELAFMVSSKDKVREIRKKWDKLGIKIEQDLHEATFGLTFVALDPDNHRIRVCIPDTV